MSKADKRERQRQNRELAKQERERLMKRDRRMRSLRGLLFVLVPVVALIVIISLLQGGDSKSKASTNPRSFKSAPKMTIDPNKTYTASIETSKGNIDVALDAKAAPIATNNFVFLARKGFYDKLCFDRVSKDFVIQGGSPTCNQQGGPGYSVAGEVPTDHYPEGSLAAAKSGSEAAGTMGSQFFIVTGSKGATLPNDYARFGKVTTGLDVAKSIEALAPNTGDGKPTQKVTIKKVTITES
ncbi:MAG: peptidylprolyl isomerase [Acidimicrobiia bacterium]